ncbi:helix-turn-helix transcriptional regulator [Vibrio genomosp. F10]|uniref:helix-turn-helix transcriptional regulator n=1 Tax=Vibrio genomosp. F10 TaxID=723171 RepID=UPI00030890A9|nr:helix-turn-helix transcriptional regulator [Vibrio genomosp. F10]OEE95826.1 transcriptional regulator [Vibrio genomosp. F10 str. 9ZD137]
MFAETLRLFRTKNGISQTQFVDLVQKSSQNFYSLDVVTLSRWERGVTTPHLKRMNELLELLGINIFDFWCNNSDGNELKALYSKLNTNAYTDENTIFNPDVVLITASNSGVIGSYLHLIDVIFNYENNAILVLMQDNGKTRRSVIEKIINQYSGELMFVLVNGQIIGHLLSSNSRLILDYTGEDIDGDEKVDLIVSCNSTHYSSFIPTLGRFVYKYIQSTDPNKIIKIHVNNVRMFNILYSIGLEYTSVNIKGTIVKVMELSSKEIKKNRAWMSIISKYRMSKK